MVSSRSHWIPIELVEQILLRLPIKSILRFTCVSRSWNQLISTREFSKHWMMLLRKFHPVRLMFRAESTHDSRHCRLLNQASWMLLHSPPPGGINVTRIMASADGSRKTTCLASGDGLLCIVFNQTKLFLWNPITGKSKWLPNFLPESEASRVRCCFGLGFDRSSQQFKVVGFVYNPRDKYNNVMVKIYGLEEDKGGEWRRIKNHTGFRRDHDFDTLSANGKLHWIVDQRNDQRSRLRRSWEIAYLDLETEEYGTLHSPPGYGYGNLVYSEGLLYVLCHNHLRGDYAYLWMIQPDYGKLDKTATWTLSVRIPQNVDGDLGQKRLVYVWRDGPQVLFSCRSKFVIFNNKDSSWTYPDIAKMPHSMVVTYAETLSSALISS